MSLQLNTIDKISHRIAHQRYMLLDGAMGTELERNGYKTKLPLWTAKATQEVPELYERLQQNYIDAGSEIITANTFRISYYLYERLDLLSQFTYDLAHAIMSSLACKEFDENLLIAGSIATLEDCYSPELRPNQETLYKYHSTQIRLLVGYPIDLIIAETINNALEAATIARICADLDFPLFLSIITDGMGNLLDGSPIRDLLDRLEKFPPVALLINCRHIPIINQDLEILLEESYLPIGIYANAPGAPHPEKGWSPTSDATRQFVDSCLQWHREGVKILGGCCGTTPEMIQSLHTALSREGISST